jgi:hypothetical protein
MNTVGSVLPVARPSPPPVNRMPEMMCRVRAADAARARPQSRMAP